MTAADHSKQAFTPIIKSLKVKATPDAAFRRFTAEIATWWPLASHSVGGRNAATVAMEGRVGGNITERDGDGQPHVWGTITAWEPPRRVAFTWHPGREPESAQDVEVTFTADGQHTRVTLKHSGFERLGALGRRARRGYPIGWAYVLGLYAGHRGPFIALIHGLSTVLSAVQRMRTRTAA